MSRLSETDSGTSGGLGETVKVIVQALLLALVIRTFLFQPFNIPSGSMIPSLLIGDFLFVSKFSYGYSRFSVPFSPPLFPGRIFASTPERGDVAVFKLPSDQKTDYIKRVIGLPGDKIQMIGGVLHINGTPVRRERVDDFAAGDRHGNITRTPQYRETLPNGVTYNTLDLVENSFADNTPVFDVPEGHYFMMGDNRDNSTDSRVPGAVGFVPLENFVGRADLIFFSVREGERAWQVWRWPFSVRGSRLLTGVE